VKIGKNSRKDVQVIWSGAGPAPTKLGWDRWPGKAERSDSPQRWYGELGTVELGVIVSFRTPVEPDQCGVRQRYLSVP
jgi:hypothetical protein